MAAALGMARRSDRTGNGHLFLVVCSSVRARVGSVLGERCEKSRAACPPTHGRALDIPVSPEPLSCKLLVARAKEAIATQSREQNQEAAVSELRSGAETLGKQTMTLDAMIQKDEIALRKYEEALKLARGDLKSEQIVLGTTMKVVAFHESQLNALEDSLHVLTKSYTSTTTA
jgi:predicted ATPase with chaperone activity